MNGRKNLSSDMRGVSGPVGIIIAVILVLAGLIATAIGIGDIQAGKEANGLMVIGIGVLLLSIGGYSTYKSKLFSYSGPTGALLLILGYIGSRI
jgi:hypothetical protein